MKNCLRIVLSVMAALVFGLSASAQVTTSNLAGKISDSEGPVIGAPVVAVYVPTGTTYYGVTDANGSYRINGVTPGGPYSISVEMLGYRKITVTDVYAALAENRILDFELEEEALGLAAAVFTADAIDSKMNIQRSGIGTSINAKKMTSVPTVSRSMNDIMKLTPQASTTTSGFAVGGGNYRGSSVTVDGAAFNNAFGIGSNLPAGGSPISLDAIDQLIINITPFDVRQSGFQGGAINAVTKSGSNEVHASVYNYFTNQDFRGHMVSENEVANNDMLSNTTGFTVGGPIIKNKLFFFVNAEYSLDTVPGSSYEARKSAGDAWGSGTMYNRPTVSEMEDMKSFLSDQFGYNPGRYQGYSLQTPDYKVLARLDWNINDNNKFNIRFSQTHNYYSSAPSSSMSPIGGTDSKFRGGAVAFNRYSAGRQSQYAMYYEAARYFQEQNFMSVAAELNSRLFDGKGNNMLRFAWSHQDEPRSYVGDFFPTVDILSSSEASGKDTYPIFTTIGIDPFTYGNLRDVQTITVTDEFTYTKGINNFIAGAQLEWNRAINGFMQGGAGWYIYDSWDSFKNDVLNPSASTGPVAFMITHANLDDPSKQAFPSFDYTQASVYAQDEMNISDYFKLTAGLRLEMPFITIPTDNYNKDFASLGEKNPNSSFAGLSTDDVPKPSINISPRLGFNWDVLKNRSLVVRGGTGIYTGRIPNVWLVSAIGNSNVLQYQYINKGVDNTKDGIHFTNNRNEIIKQLYAGNAFQKQDLTAPTATTIISQDLKMPSSWKTSISVDAQLPFGIKGSLEGIYSKNFNEVYATSLGYKQNGTVRLPGEPENRNLWASEGVTNSAGKNVNGYYVHNVKGVNGSYYSLTAQLSRDFNFGLSLMAAYTHSNSMTASDGNGDQISEFANIYNRNGCNEPELGYSNYVAPNRVIASIAYNINEGSHTATKLGLFYEGYNQGYISSYSYSRVSYLINNQSGAGTAAQTLYIPTDSEVDQMTFGTLKKLGTKDAKGNDQTVWEDAPAMAQAYKDFLASDKYTSKHRGEYSTRNAIVAPWLNRFNVKVGQEFYFNIASRKNVLELSVDINNIGNMINSNWGVYKQLNTNVIMTYDKNNPAVGSAEKRYTFTAPKWSSYNNLASTWQMLFSAKWSF